MPPTNPPRLNSASDDRRGFGERRRKIVKVDRATFRALYEGIKPSRRPRVVHVVSSSVDKAALGLGWSRHLSEERPPHKVMTPEEYATTPIVGWHEVCRDLDGAGGIGIRYLGYET
jgi:hypothetical protein